MAAPYQATIVQISSGHITFNDPTKAWTPDDFPNLPKTSLGLTTRGRIEDATFDSIRLTNAITYEPFEPASVHPILQKSFVIAQNGDVTLQEAKMGFISTISPPFEANVTEFTPSTIGGANIYDAVSSKPDTVTNAIAKLDAWINNAFLQQPPAVQVAQNENTSLFAGVRWRNFNTYNVMDKFVPYVTSMVFLIGDPETPDYLTFEIHNCKYFPYKTYRDGISPEGAPLVRLRIFSDDYGVINGNVVCKKNTLYANGITLLQESGNLTLPSLGPVLSLNHTNGEDTYTTLSLYIPNIQLTYPLNSKIPVRVFYLNRTEGGVNTMSTFVTQTDFGAPSQPQNLRSQTVYSNALQIVVDRPVYSDSTGGITDPYFSTYKTEYKYHQLATAHAGNIGFQYGLPSPTTLPSSMSSFTSVYTQINRYVSSTQTISTTATIPPIYPGTVWSTNVSAVNLAEFQDGESAGVYASTLFGNHTTFHISTIPLVTPNTFVAHPYTRYIPVYTFGSGWSIGTPLDHALVFVSSPTYLTTRLSTFVQFNDPSYPGDRSTMTLKSYYTDPQSNTQLTDTLVLSTINERFILDEVQNSELIGTYLQDINSNIGYADYYYKAQHVSFTLVSTIIGPHTQEAFISFTNRLINGYTAPILEQTYSTPNFVFETTSSLRYNTTDIIFTNTVTSTVAVSGLYTPTPQSLIYVDVLGSNFAQYYTHSNFVTAEIRIPSLNIPLTSQTNTTSNQVVRNTATSALITTRPFPVDTLLTFSSIKLNVNDFIYTDPVYNFPLSMTGKVVSANPEHSIIPYSSTLTQLYVDTYSAKSYTNFTSTTGIYGKRILSLLPRLEDPGTPTNMNDGISEMGEFGSGLNVAISSFIFMSTGRQIVVSSFVDYNHTSSLSTFTTDPYSRELLYTRGRYVHAAGYNFTSYTGTTLGVNNAIYPDFTYDKYFDETKGNRFASFMFEQPALSEGIPLQYLMVTIHKPSYVSTVSGVRSNNFFPANPVLPYLASTMRVHVHAKIIGEYDVGQLKTVESAWVNCLKQVDELTFDDSTYDVGGCSLISFPGNVIPSSGSNLDYINALVHFNRRYYTKIGVIVRVGISLDGSMYSGDPLTFDGISVSFSD